MSSSEQRVTVEKTGAVAHVRLNRADKRNGLDLAMFQGLIEAGEELCHDYAMARVEPYALDCLCGTAVCRGTVRDTDWQRPDVQARYAGYFMPHVQTRIDAA